MNELFSCVSIISGFNSFLGFCFVMRAFVTAFSVFALLCTHLLLLSRFLLCYARICYCFIGFCFVMHAFVTAFSVFALLCAHLLLLYFPEEEAQISKSLNDAINMFSNSLTFNIILFFICPSALWQKREMTYFIRYSPDPCLFQHSHSSIYDPTLHKK